jgi:REP element-mobilizing transposase RayT
MPNHIHVLFRLGAGHALGAVVHTWKSYSANAVNRALGRAGALWHDDYWDRLVRDEGHLASSRDYIRDNPAKGRLGAGEYLLYQAD